MSTPRPPLRALLIDLSGTLHIGNTPTPGAVRALSRLRSSPPSAPGSSATPHPPYRFCSNTSKESAVALGARLAAMGFALREDTQELWTSLGAVAARLRARGVRRPLCLLERGAEEEVLRALGPAPDGAPYDAVVLGLASSRLSYDGLSAAFRVLLAEPRPPLVATHRAKYVRTEDKASSSAPEGANDTLALGPGPFVAALENAAGVQAEVVGKPTRAFFEAVIGSFGEDEMLPDGKIAIIGDDVETDLGGGAVELGLWRVLVRTGKYRPGDEHRPGVVPPDEVHDSFAAFVESLLG
ncbi:HAD-like domain-containing protein [Phanerochaete sordida]|uniref:HAD-like domain-containing protein n=1 Tax=Phanerochaete sordida TaxID=48140 RepID=A0A9P3GLM1_9APHY|nr:HAD-like domain-containing protein [Phanerochaete sordida]